MSPYVTVSSGKLARLVGLPQAPAPVGVRTDEDFAADPRLLPGEVRRPSATVASWAGDFTEQSVVVVCQRGAKLSQGAAAWLRHDGISAEVLEGGFVECAGRALPLVPETIPPPPGLRRTGGPAGQIAPMHRELVDDRRWISDARFLHALNSCMLLPGPEAQQLAATSAGSSSGCGAA